MKKLFTIAALLLSSLYLAESPPRDSAVLLPRSAITVLLASYFIALTYFFHVSLISGVPEAGDSAAKEM